MNDEEYNIAVKVTLWTHCAVLKRREDGLWIDGYVVSVYAQHPNLAWQFTILDENGIEIVHAWPLCHDYSSFDCVRRLDDGSHIPSPIPRFSSDADMLRSMGEKYCRKGLYTIVGPILYSVNPNEKIALYEPVIVDTYIRAGAHNQMHLLPPHSFLVADKAYRHMFMDPFDSDMSENQTILILGDSGAGKTECTKQIVRYLMALSSQICRQYGESSDYEVEMEALVLTAIPMTESFGNAKTVANDNSSRYGSYVELNFGADGYLEGAAMRTYLLEYARVCQQPLGERTFHIFYEVLAGLSADRKEELGLTRACDYFYLMPGGIEDASGELGRKDVSDAAAFAQLTSSMDKVGFSQHSQFEIFKVIASVLHVGNIDFLCPENPSGQDGDGPFIPIAWAPSSAAAVKYVCRLLSVSEQDLLRSFVMKKKVPSAVKGRRECDSGDCGGAGDALTCRGNALLLRDRLAKTLYSSLFNWVMVEINRKLGEKTGNSSVASIGLLDTIGFEDIGINSFGQLCINYGAEKWHNYMLHHLFFREQEIYEAEGVSWTTPPPCDNRQVLDLFENKKVGVFASLKQCRTAFDVDVWNALRDNDRRVTALSGGEGGKYQFRIRHSNRDVTYSASHFLEKNRGIREINFSALFLSSEGRVHSFDSDNSSYLKTRAAIVCREASSASSVMTARSRSSPDRACWSKRSERQALEHSCSSIADDSREAKLSVGSRTRSVSSSFRNEMSALIAHIRTTRSHFIKCLNPNETRTPGLFDRNCVARQFRPGEVRSVMSLHEEPFPMRMATEIWIRKYRVCLSPVGISASSLKKFELLKVGYSCRIFKFAAEGIASMLPVAGRVLNILNNDSALIVEPEVLGKGLRVSRNYVFLSRACHHYIELLRLRSLEFIVLRLQSLRALARAPPAGSARTVAQAAMSAHRHGLTARIRRKVVAGMQIQQWFRRWVRRGRYALRRRERLIRRNRSARRIQMMWKHFVNWRRASGQLLHGESMAVSSSGSVVGRKERATHPPSIMRILTTSLMFAAPIFFGSGLVYFFRARLWSKK